MSEGFKSLLPTLNSSAVSGSALCAEAQGAIMMHYNNSIITLKELPRKTVVRETAHNRVGTISDVTVYLPFDSEYAIGYKFTDGRRRRLELWIDGSRVTDSLILSGEGLLDRFQDTDRRFKFVKATNEAVADPTSSQNGLIEIKLFTEKPVVFYTPAKFIPQWPNPVSPWTPRYGDTQFINTSSSSSGFACSASATNDLSFGASSVFEHCVRGVTPPSDMGATVEGSKSDMTFKPDHWYGDENSLPSEVFRFHVKGQVVQQKAIQCPYCNTYNQSEASRCKSCGVEFVKATV